MRLPVVGTAIAFALLCPGQASAGQVTTPVGVHATVPESCQFETPSNVSVDGHANPVLTASSFVSDCNASVAPVLTKSGASAQDGAYLETINF